MVDNCMADDHAQRPTFDSILASIGEMLEAARS
jgi:hypothetical protein